MHPKPGPDSCIHTQCLGMGTAGGTSQSLSQTGSIHEQGREGGREKEGTTKKQCLLCFMSVLLSLGSRKDFKQINSPLVWQTALAANFRP